MAYKINSTTVIDNDKQVISTSTITATSFVGKGIIPSGTTVTFQQANAPTGFTKITLYNDYALRVVSGTGGVTGGTTNFTTAFPPAATVPISVTVSSGDVTLTTPQIASHSHTGAGTDSPGFIFGPVGAPVNAQIFITDPTGGSGSHSHPVSPNSASIDLRVKYVDVILATRDA
jgi:hypothetical protein